jgi:outer membrane protein assembly factor BamB
MTDHELIQLVQNKAPQELTPEELDALRTRLPHSAALCEALQGQVAFEQFLGERLGQVSVSLDGIYAQAIQHPHRSRRTAALLGWLFTIGLCLIAVGTAVWMRARPPEKPGSQIEPDKTASVDRTKPEEPQTAATGQADPAAIENKAAATDPDSKQSPSLPPPDKHAGENVAATGTPAESGADVETTQPRIEWPELEAEPAAARTAAAAALADFAVDSRGLNQKELLRWLAPVSGHNHRVFESQRANLMVAGFEGLLRWKAPWPDNAVLRLSLFEFDGFAMYLWNGGTGVALHFHQHPRPCWAAYEISRDEGEPRPSAYGLVATDNDRFDRTGQGPVELRQQEGTLVLSRGDVRLLTAPLSEPPREVYFDRRATIRSLTMYRGEPFPDDPIERADNVLETSVPAQLKWKTRLPEGASFTPSGIGHVELDVAPSAGNAWVSTKLPREGLFELVAEIEGASPGTALYLGDDSGKPVYLVGYVRDQRTGQTVLANVRTETRRFEETYDHFHQPTPYAPHRHWLKLVAGSGTLKCWISTDGTHWSRAVDPQRMLQGRYSQIGLAGFKTDRPRSITLRSLRVQELTSVSGLAAPELAARVPATVISESRSYPAWLQRVVETQPADVPPEEWIRACAVRTLATVPAASVGNGLLHGLLEYNLRRPAEAEDRLRTIEQAARLFDAWEPQECFRLTRHFELVAEHLANRGERRAYSATARLFMTAPVWTTAQFQTMPEAVARGELLELIYRDLWREALETCRSVRFFNRPSQPENRWREPRLKALTEWAEATAQRALPPGAEELAGGVAPLPAAWRHPLSVELSKEGYNTLAELEAALSEESYRDACQIIQSISPDTALALLPDGRDPHLLLALPQAVDAAIREHPGLRRTTIEEFGELGALRRRQAAAASDVAGMQAVTVQFPGTEAAAEAHQWLGDRALAAGDFVRALGEFGSGLQSCAPWQRRELAARQRLAGALLGHDVGEPVVESVTFQNETIPGPDFEQLVAEMRGKATGGAIGPSTPVDAPRPAAVARYVAEHRGTWKGTLGRDPEHRQPADIDWAARQLACVPAGETMYVSNRFQVSAFDLAEGKVRWTHDVGNDQGRVHSWLYAPMRPIVVGKRVFVRMLRKQGPELVCLSADNGELLWTAARAVWPICDPLLIQDRLHIFGIAAAAQEGISVVELLLLDPKSGAVESRTPLMQLRNAWDRQIPCDAAVIGGRLVANIGGSVLCCNPTGEVLWIRRQTWLPVAVDATAESMERVPPLSDGERLYIMQANVAAVECLDVRTGRRLWISPQPGLRSVLGLLPDRVVIATEQGVRSLAPADGAVQWTTPIAGRLYARVVCTDGRLLVLRAEPTEPDRYRPVMTWLDAANGEPVAEFPLEGLEDKHPRIGPMVVQGERLWTFFGKGTRDASREIYTLTPLADTTPQEPHYATAIADWTFPPGDERAAISAGLLLPGWAISGGGGEGHLRSRSEFQGEQQVLATRAEPDRPVLLLREVALPESARARFVIRAAHDRHSTWMLSVRVGERELLAQPVEETATTGGWGEWTVDLAEFAGRTVWIAVEHRAIDKPATAYWKRLEIIREP